MKNKLILVLLCSGWVFFSITDLYARPLSKEDIISLSKMDYRGRIEQSLDLSDDGNDVLFITCDQNYEQHENDSGALYYFNPNLKQTITLLKLDVACHKSGVHWSSNKNEFYVHTKISNTSFLKTFILSDNKVSERESQVFDSYDIHLFSPNRKFLALLKDEKELLVINLVSGEKVKFENLPKMIRVRGLNYINFFTNGDFVFVHQTNASFEFYKCTFNVGEVVLLATWLLPENINYLLDFIVCNENIYFHVNYKYSYSKPQLFKIDLSSNNKKAEVVRSFDTTVSIIDDKEDILLLEDFPKTYESKITGIDSASGQIKFSHQLSHSWNGLLSDHLRFHNHVAVYIGSQLERPFPEIIYEDFRNNHTYKLTDFSKDIIAGIELPSLEPISFMTSDGFEVTGYVMGLSKENKKPLIVAVQGGPHVWEPPSPYYMIHSIPYYMFLKEQGFSVLLLNPRGGWDNYSLDPIQMYGADWPKKAVKDMEEAVDYLKTKLGAKISKIGVTGQSAGGFFTAWAMTLSSMVDAAMPVSAGYDIYNSIFQDKNGDQYRNLLELEWKWPYGAYWPRIAPEIIPNYVPMDIQKRMFEAWKKAGTPILPMSEFNELNPIENVQNLKAATLMIHTGKDHSECHPDFAKNFYNKIKKFQNEGVLASDDPLKYQLVIYENENHVIEDPKNMEDFMDRSVEFFKKYLVE